MVRRSCVRAFGAAAILGAVCLPAWLRAAADSSLVADAAQAGDRQAVTALIRQAAEVNAAQGDGMTALHWAAQRNDTDLARMLLYAGANVRATTRING